MYVDISASPCLIVGGGTIAYRKAEVLRDFGAQITVVAEKFCARLQQYAAEDPEHIRLIEKSYEDNDCEGKLLVVAATERASVNHAISEYCKSRGIPVNAVDQKEDCTFIFPSYVRQGDVVAAFSSAGKSPLLTQLLKEKETDILTPLYGELNECLGNLRPFVKSRFATGEERKKAYQTIISWTKEHGVVPDESKAREILFSLDYLQHHPGEKE
jgi:uroporphyrin-III C-methyltransferase/precorrin-2 dehydrogenase/sirohydrochlorin ferrochelatase/precorrin-2 dehydrogenase/sirohydrochlorin ferrochelatase